MPIPNLSNDDDTSGDLKGVPVCLGEIEGIFRVVSVKNATKKLKIGDKIRLNATKGLINVI